MLHGPLARSRFIVFLGHVVMRLIQLLDRLVQPRNPARVQIRARMILEALAVIGHRLDLRQRRIDFREGVAFLIVQLAAIRMLDQRARGSQVAQRAMI